MDKKLATLIAGTLLLVVILSGCLTPATSGPGRVGAAPGIVITNFRTDFSSIDADEEMFVALNFENRGDAPAGSITGTLIRKGSFTVTDEYSESPSDLEIPLDDVYSSDEFTWKIKAPSVTQDRSDEIQARLYYEYWTEGYATIHFVPKDIIREKGASSFSIESSSTNGPIGIDITANQPVTIENETEKTVRVTITLTNEGTGKVESNKTMPHGSCSKGLDCIDSVQVEGWGTTCKVKKGSVFSKLDNTTNGVKLIQGEQGLMSTSHVFEITDTNAETSCQIKVRANYRYRIDSSVLPITIIAAD